MAPLPEQPIATSPPMVYVSEKIVWEYKQIAHNLSEGKVPTEEELNKLGKDGWELAGVFNHAGVLYLYFKRIKP